MKKQFKVIIPETWDNNEKGKFWEKLIADLLRRQGWCVKERIKFTGMEIDGYAYHPEHHQQALIEGKFYNDKLINSPIINNLLGKAFRKEVKFAYLFTTTALNSDASGILQEEEYKNKTDPDRKPILIVYEPDKLAQLFTDVKGISLPDVRQKGIGRVEVVTLLITPEQTLWIAEEIGRQGLPSRAIVFPTSENDSIKLEELQACFSKENLWQGLEILDGTTINSKEYQNSYTTSDVDDEMILQISKADSFEDYRPPCHPKYFVGRSNLQDKFWEFAKNVRDGETDTRIFCFFGRSGLGKSSLVLKLTEDCFQQDRYRNNFYLYHVDVRAASLSKNTIFVISAIKKAIQQAVGDQFISLPNHNISIESTEQPLFSSSSIEPVIKNLSLNKRVLIIFFDQFEYLFTKEPLLYIYELFEKAAHEVHSLKENIVLGFCWRTGIVLPDGHKAYHLWHGLADKRRDIEVKEFVKPESKALLKQFENHLTTGGRKLDQKLKKWLLEHCPGFPWLLRKLCGDIYKQILSQSDIPSHQVDIKQVDIRRLFEKDLEVYVTTREQEACLKYIAKHTLVGMSEVIERFGSDVIQSLENTRLVIRTGINYTISWDIFREYVLEGKVPTIPLSYRPRHKVTRVLEVLRIFKEEGKTEIRFSDLLNLSKKNDLENIVYDLANFFQFIYYKSQKVIAQEELLKLNYQQLADYLAKQLEDHVVVIELYAKTKPGQIMTLWGLQELVQTAYHLEVKTRRDYRSRKDYTSRILSWLCFAGLLEQHQNNRIIRPIGEGQQKGKPSLCESAMPMRDTRQLELNFSNY